MTSQAHSLSSRTNSVSFAFITVFLDAMGIGVIIPVIPDLIQELTQTTISEAAILGGYLSFVYALMQFLLGPTLGNLSDRFGRRPILLISLAALAIDYVIMGFAPNLLILFIGRFIAGIAGATHATAFALTADLSLPDERTKNFGLVSAAFGFGFIAGPIIGGLVAEFGTRAPFFAAAGLVFINFLFGLLILPETLKVENRRSFEWKRSNPVGAFLQALVIPGLVLFFLAFFLYQLAGNVYAAIWPYYTKEAFDFSSKEIGLSLGIFGIFYALTQIFLIRFMLSRFRESSVAIIGIILEAVGMIGFLFIFEGWVLFLYLPFSALGSVAAPAIQGLMSRHVPDDAQGELQGAVSSILAITTIFSPLLMTQLFAFFTQTGTSHYHPAGAFGIAAIITFVVLIPLRHGISSISKAK